MMTEQAMVLRPGTGMAAPVVNDAEMKQLWRLATQLYQSGMFPSTARAEQAYAKILLGRDLGLSPTQSMTAINMIDGRPELSSVTLAYFVRVREGYDFKVNESTKERCEIEFFVGDESRGTVTFDLDDAQRADLLRKDNWKKYPQDMLFWRTMSRGVKRLVPEVIAGVPVYYEGEISRESDYTLGPDDAEPITGTVILAPAVERVIERAKALGHDGLADRATAEMTLAGQEEPFVRQWVEQATEELDGMERVGDATAARTATSDTEGSTGREQAESDPVPSSSSPVDEEGVNSGSPSADQLRAQAEELLDQAAAVRENDGTLTDAEAEEIAAYEDEAAQLQARATELEE